MRRVASVMVLVVAGGLAAAARQPSAGAVGVEDIYVARSLRLSRVAPTEYCAERRTGFGNATFEDQYNLLATATDATDGKVTSASGKVVGRLHACLGATPDPLTLTFFAEGTLGTTPFTGRGECRGFRQDFPEAGLTPLHCFLQLTDLPVGYVGGQLTTNTILSRQALGDVSDPAGYVQASIATARLWKKR